MTARRVVSALVLLGAAALAAPAPARAQSPPQPGMTGAGPATVSPVNSPETAPAPKLSRRSVKLFDGRTNPRFWELDLGPIWTRKTTDRAPGEELRNAERGTGEISLGMAFVNQSAKGLYLVGVQRTLLRVADSKTFSWSVFHQDLGGGLRLGPVEPEVRMGLSFFTVDVFRGDWSVQSLTPRVTAGVGLSAGKFRLDIKAHSEYLWRWFGPDYLAHGVTLGLRLEAPPLKSPFEEAR